MPSGDNKDGRLINTTWEFIKSKEGQAMNEDFVPKGLAIKLRERGFIEECIRHYQGDNLLWNSMKVEPYYDKVNTSWAMHSYNRFGMEKIDAPTISQAMKWLRKEKKIYIIIDRSFSYKSWHYCIIIDDDFENLISQTVSRKQTWEQAALKAIEYVLDNLISNKTT